MKGQIRVYAQRALPGKPLNSSQDSDPEIRKWLKRMGLSLFEGARFFVGEEGKPKGKFNFGEVPVKKDSSRMLMPCILHRTLQEGHRLNRNMITCVFRRQFSVENKATSMKHPWLPLKEPHLNCHPCCLLPGLCKLLMGKIATSPCFH